MKRSAIAIIIGAVALSSFAFAPPASATEPLTTWTTACFNVGLRLRHYCGYVDADKHLGVTGLAHDMTIYPKIVRQDGQWADYGQVRYSVRRFTGEWEEIATLGFYQNGYDERVIDSARYSLDRPGTYQFKTEYLGFVGTVYEGVDNDVPVDLSILPSTDVSPRVYVYPYRAETPGISCHASGDGWRSSGGEVTGWFKISNRSAKRKTVFWKLVVWTYMGRQVGNLSGYVRLRPWHHAERHLSIPVRRGSVARVQVRACERV